MTAKKEYLVKIASVKLQTGGLKGAEVVYEKTSRRNSQDFIKSRKEINPEPVHGELINLFDSLCNFLLDICSYTTQEVERLQLVNELEMTGVTYGPKGFVLSGKLRVLGSNSKKVIPLNTPLITPADTYGDYDKVVEILDKIYPETADYMSGLKTFTNDELIMRFNKNDEEFKDVFKDLDEDGKKKMATEILEKLGSVVIHREDTEIEMGEEIGGKIVSMSERVVSKEEEAPILLEDEEDDNFTLELPVLKEEKESTAKKKKQG